MVETADDDGKKAADILENKAKSLLAERARLRLGLVRDAARDVQITRDITGCVAGATALGYRLELPPPDDTPEGKAYIVARNSIWQLEKHFSSLVPPELIDAAKERHVISAPVQQPSVPPPSIPKVADIVLDRLRAAGKSGGKAADIRSFISQSYHVDVHEKTVGMTLYRLQKAHRVTRDGHTWFLASSEAKNPGVTAPGPIKSQD